MRRAKAVDGQPDSTQRPETNPRHGPKVREPGGAMVKETA